MSRGRAGDPQVQDQVVLTAFNVSFSSTNPDGYPTIAYGLIDNSAPVGGTDVEVEIELIDSMGTILHGVVKLYHLSRGSPVVDSVPESGWDIGTYAGDYLQVVVSDLTRNAIVSRITIPYPPKGLMNRPNKSIRQHRIRKKNRRGARKSG